MPREHIFARKVHLEDLVLEIPQVPRFCDKIELEKGKLDVDNCKLYVEQEGEGTPVVLLHGGPGATHHYFHPFFSRAKYFARIIYYDQRGCGLSDWNAGNGYSIEQAVSDLESLRKKLNIEKWVVLGHSYGGLLAQCYAVEHPENLQGLVLVSSQTAMFEKLKPSRRDKFISKEEENRIKNIDQIEGLSVAQRLYNAAINGDWKCQHYYKPSREEFAQSVLYEWNHDARFRSKIGRQSKNIDLKGAFDYFPVPTLIMEGRWDLTWDLDKMKILCKNHPNADLEIFESSSHCSFVDQPEEFFNRLGSFVDDLSQATDVATYKDYLSEWRQKKEKTVEHIVRTVNYNHLSYKRIVESYEDGDFQKFDDPMLLWKVGIALYDFKRYEESAKALEKMGEISKEKELRAMALTWQAHSLDLLGKRKEAVYIYERVKKMDLGLFAKNSQFDNLELSTKYAAERMKEPFQRIEVNR